MVDRHLPTRLTRIDPQRLDHDLFDPIHDTAFIDRNPPSKGRQSNPRLIKLKLLIPILCYLHEP